MRLPVIKHPEWLDEERIFTGYRLYRAGRLPKVLEGFMLATPLIHELRAIYGSDFRAGCAILWGAFVRHVELLRYRLGLLSRAERATQQELEERIDA